MKWLKRQLAQWVNDYNNTPKLSAGHGKLIASGDSDNLNSEPILNFRVFAAVGGKVVEFRLYDRKTDRSQCQTYIITNDEDFGDAVAKIATLELMKT